MPRQHNEQEEKDEKAIKFSHLTSKQILRKANGQVLSNPFRQPKGLNHL